MAGDNAANPMAPTVRPTNALSILDNSGLVKYIPNAGMANLSICRFDVSDDDVLLLLLLFESLLFDVSSCDDENKHDELYLGNSTRLLLCISLSIRWMEDSLLVVLFSP